MNYFIYLLTNEKIKINAVKTSGGKSFSEQTVRGTSIVMNSDKLFFNDELRTLTENKVINYDINFDSIEELVMNEA